MTPFVRLDGHASALREDDIDTDVIFPARFLLITARAGLGRYAFHDRRFAADGSELPDFVLNSPSGRGASILLAGANFGCGSSREQAVWALLDLGIACVIAPSFGEIFHANCIRNGVLPIVLDAGRIAALAGWLTIDLAAQTVTPAGGEPLPFLVARDNKEALLNGWDETAMILTVHGGAIDAFEVAQRAAAPWLYAGEAA